MLLCTSGLNLSWDRRVIIDVVWIECYGLVTLVRMRPPQGEQGLPGATTPTCLPPMQHTCPVISAQLRSVSPLLTVLRHRPQRVRRGAMVGERAIRREEPLRDVASANAPTRGTCQAARPCARPTVPRGVMLSRPPLPPATPSGGLWRSPSREATPLRELAEITGTKCAA